MQRTYTTIITLVSLLLRNLRQSPPPLLLPPQLPSPSPPLPPPPPPLPPPPHLINSQWCSLRAPPRSVSSLCHWAAARGREQPSQWRLSPHLKQELPSVFPPTATRSSPHRYPIHPRLPVLPGTPLPVGNEEEEEVEVEVVEEPGKEKAKSLRSPFRVLCQGDQVVSRE